MVDTGALTSMTSALLAESGDPDKAAPMAAYMKTDMAFHGVQKNGRVPVMRAVQTTFPPSCAAEYVEAVESLWKLPHREEKYIAIGYARAFDEFIEKGSLRLYRRLIIEGAWWDFVDEIASKLVGRVLEKDRVGVTSIIRPWIFDGDLWLRRTSIICQLDHQSDTDTELLGDACVANMGDPDFFIRKAIGWALRQYARTDRAWVRTFIAAHRDELSPLTLKEATKHFHQTI